MGSTRRCSRRSPSCSFTVAIMVRRMSLLPLTPDELLSTTRAVRKRLDFDRPVPDDLIRECVALAMQSPSGSNNMSMQFVVVRDPAKKAAIGEIYRQCFEHVQDLGRRVHRQHRQGRRRGQRAAGAQRDLRRLPRRAHGRCAGARHRAATRVAAPTTCRR